MGGQYQSTSRSLLFTRERLLTATAVLNRRLRDIYKRGTLHSVRVMLGAGSFSGILTRYRYLPLIASYDRTLVRRVRELETNLVQENASLQSSMVSLDRLRQSRLSEVAALRSVEATHRRALDGYHAQEETAPARLEHLELDETEWSVVQVSEGALGFDQLGCAERITGPLAAACVPVLYVSTFSQARLTTLLVYGKACNARS